LHHCFEYKWTQRVEGIGGSFLNFFNGAQSFSNSFKGLVGLVRKSGKSSSCVLLHFYDPIFRSLLRGYMRCQPPPPFKYSIHRVQFVKDTEARELKTTNYDCVMILGASKAYNKTNLICGNGKGLVTTIIGMTSANVCSEFSICYICLG
jgi:hypothetical protein